VAAEQHHFCRVTASNSEMYRARMPRADIPESESVEIRRFAASRHFEPYCGLTEIDTTVSDIHGLLEFAMATT